jgi:beta-aspartyl-dipeptidase (metallo-type)
VVGVLGTDDTTRDTGALVATVRGLCEEGLSAYCHTGGYHLPPVTLTGSVRGDMVHVDRIIGIGEVAISDHRSSQPTLEEIVRLASEAHVAGLMTGKAGILHLHLGDGERGLELVRRALDMTELPARVFNPTHVNRRKALFEAALELARRGCTIDLTAFPVAEEDDAWSAEQALGHYLDTDLPPQRITVSSDGGGCLPVYNRQCELLRLGVGDPGALVACLQSLLRQGAPLQAVLPAFTSNVAQLLRLPRKGVIGVGADADLVVLDDEAEISDVMALGRWHVRAGKPVVFGSFETSE